MSTIVDLNEGGERSDQLLWDRGGSGELEFVKVSSMIIKISSLMSILMRICQGESVDYSSVAYMKYLTRENMPGGLED